MKPAVPTDPPLEIELKLALPTSDPASLERRLARLPVLARRKPNRQQLHSVYYDTPEQTLRQQSASLRIRRVGTDARPHWLQTLKTGPRVASALRQRGEWESPVPNGTLTMDVLQATPWPDIDTDGTVFQALSAAFETRYERTSWLVRRRDGSKIEVALDIGNIVVGANSASICELELELLAGPPTALFELAQQIAVGIAVLPVSTSKAERGYALAEDSLGEPLRARPAKLTSRLPVTQAAGHVLREMFYQFTGNLNALRTSDDTEVVHQARVGWRRFKSALRLFKPALLAAAVPSWQGLDVLLTCLGELRDLDVARVDALPPLEQLYVAGDDSRAKAWQAMTHTLEDATQIQRKTVRYALHDPAVGVNLVAATQWLEALCAPLSPDHLGVAIDVPLRRWSRRRIVRLNRRLKAALHADTATPDTQHRVRILAKRTRYAIEALRIFLPKRSAQQWLQQATSLQLSLGNARDVMQACMLLAKLQVDRGLVEFVRGVAVGQTKSP